MGAPFICVTDNGAYQSAADIGFQELVSAPWIGRMNRTKPVPGTNDSICEYSRCGRQDRSAAPAVTLCTDPGTVDFRHRRQHLPRGQNVIGRGSKRELCLVGHCRSHVPCPETVQHKCRKAQVRGSLGMRYV